MFVWLTLPAGIDTMALLSRAIERGVAFVPGAPFFADNAPTNTLRLSFVTVPPEKIRAAVAVLGELIGHTLVEPKESK
jgi:2-aminoadipate transaminase